MYRTVVAAALTLLFVVVGFALVVPVASAECVPSGDRECPPPVCNGDAPCLCHNIGGPRDLGANCDRGSGTCTVVTDGGVTITLGTNQFLGILIGAPTSGPALAAHLAHGDGTQIQATFSPRLHLASDGLNHQAANVDCLATRAVAQPPDHGN